MNERDIFEDVTFSIDDIVENVTIRFPMKRNNTLGERRSKTVKPKDINFREIRYRNMGKCFEISLDQFGEPLGYIEFYLKMSGYIYVNSEGQFHNRDSFSKVAYFPAMLQIQIQIQAQVQIQKHENKSQFHNRDSFSKVEVKLGNCLWIELTYEVSNQSVNVY